MKAGIDLKRLHLFRQVVECGGLSAAEKVLDINLPTISAHLAALEASLGMRLCDRGRRGFRLTAQGRSVLAACDRLFDSVAQFQTTIGELDQRVSGHLRIGVVDNGLSDERSPVLPALRALQARGRGLEIGIEVRNPSELERALQEERIDVAVGPFGPTDPELESIEIHRERLSLYVGAGHPLFGRSDVVIAELAGLDAVMRGYLRESQVVQQRVAFNYCATAQHLEGIALLLLTGRYVGYLPEHYAARWLQEGRMRCLLPQAMSYEVPFRILAPRQRRSRAADAFVRLVRAEAGGDGR